MEYATCCYRQVIVDERQALGKNDMRCSAKQRLISCKMSVICSCLAVLTVQVLQILPL